MSEGSTNRPRSEVIAEWIEKASFVARIVCPHGPDWNLPEAEMTSIYRTAPNTAPYRHILSGDMFTTELRGETAYSGSKPVTVISRVHPPRSLHPASFGRGGSSQRLGGHWRIECHLCGTHTTWTGQHNDDQRGPESRRRQRFQGWAPGVVTLKPATLDRLANGLAAAGVEQITMADLRAAITR